MTNLNHEEIIKSLFASVYEADIAEISIEHKEDNRYEVELDEVEEIYEVYINEELECVDVYEFLCGELLDESYFYWEIDEEGDPCWLD